MVTCLDSRLSYIPERPGEARETLAQNTLLRLIFGWRPTVELEDWISGQG